MRTPTVLFALVLLGMGTPPTEQLLPRQDMDFALFFAVSVYQDTSLNMSQPLQNAHDLAGELKRRFGFHTEVVPNPTLEEIRQKLYEYRDKFNQNQLPQDGQLLIFFSGHGDKEFGHGYFLPADVQRHDVFATGLPYDQWRGFIDDINCRHILVAVDACYSVTFDPNWESRTGSAGSRFSRPGELSEAERALENHHQYPARLFFTSDSQEDRTPGRSNFARKLLEGLANHRSGGEAFLTAQELFASYVSKAQPTPNAGDFGRDDPRSSFLFFYATTANLGDARADQTAWQQAQAAHTLPAYRQYLRDYPNGDFRLSAEQKIVQLEAEERELIAWQEAKAANTPQAYAAFLANYPNSVYREEAERRRGAVPPPVSNHLVFIPGGAFDMGDTFGESESNEKPVHRVTVGDFYLGRTEVTFAAFDAFCAATRRELPNDAGWGRGQRPVINVSWLDAVAYCNWRSTQEGLTPVYTINGDNVTANWAANGYRLPTEAEWEYAARRGGQQVRFGDGRDVADPARINFDASAGGKTDYSVVGEYRERTVPVGSLNAPNALGLHDMSGNVWEWCWDWYGSYPTGAQTNPRGSGQGTYRVFRGGGWLTYPRHCRAADRSGWNPADRGTGVGFRLARS